MTPQLKKVLLIGGSLLAIAAGIAIYSYRKNKPDNTDTGGDSSKESNPESGSDIPSDISPSSNVKPSRTSTGSGNLGVAYKPTKLVTLIDYLSENTDGANGKSISAKIDGLKVYDLAGKEAFKTTKDKFLGRITKATKDSKGTIMIYFKGGANGVDYKMPSVGLNVAI
jgi:hypothetical protein